MKIIYSIAVISIVSLAVACGAGAKDKKGDLNDKKVQLQKLKDQQTKTAEEIKKLEDEIAILDPNAVEVKPKLVSTTTLGTQSFDHYIDLQGKLDAENMAAVTPRGPGGQVKNIYVKEGDHVTKGQLLLKLDDAIPRQQIEQAKVQLDLAKSTYERRKNLWDQKIGSEQEYLVAKNQVESLQKQVELLKEQLDMTNVYAEISGVADLVNIKVGEYFTPATSGLTGIRIVNSTNLKAVVEIPENYLSRIRKGTAVLIDVPDIHQTFNSNISLISQVINNNSRTFKAEAKLPSATNVKPNQIVQVHIKDYSSANTIVIPVNTLQTDEQGKYVYVVATEKGKKVARKKQVQVGEIYGDKIEVKTGLASGDELISGGFQSVYDGQTITTEVK